MESQTYLASETLERKLLDDSASEGGPAFSSLSTPRRPHRANTDHSNAATPVLGALSTLAEEVQKLNSNIGLLSATVAPKFDISASVSQQPGVNRRGKRARLNTDNAHATRSDSADTTIYETLDGAPNIPTEILTGDRLEALVDAYFLRVHPWIPMVHEGTFRRKVQERIDGGHIPLILHAILVGALRLLNSTEHRLSVDYLEREIERSRAKIILAASDGLSIESLQSLIIVAFTYVSRP